MNFPIFFKPFFTTYKCDGIHRVLSSVLLSSNRKKYKRELLHLTVKYLKKTRISSFPASNFMIIHSIQGCAIQHFSFTLKSITLISRTALKCFQHFQKRDKYSLMNKGNVLKVDIVAKQYMTFYPFHNIDIHTITICSV